MRDEPYPAALTDELLAGPRRRQRPQQFVLEPVPRAKAYSWGRYPSGRSPAAPWCSSVCTMPPRCAPAYPCRA
ncbi:hypothetical protein [Streptomyces misionensis]|uniref:hypothetical protein n=1 Tax=Streptomyces misionensis TaxID=67331 RepID=UPI00339F77BA